LKCSIFDLQLIIELLCYDCLSCPCVCARVKLKGTFQELRKYMQAPKIKTTDHEHDEAASK
jgi:hypothetical protein